MSIKKVDEMNNKLKVLEGHKIKRIYVNETMKNIQITTDSNIRYIITTSNTGDLDIVRSSGTISIEM